MNSKHQWGLKLTFVFSLFFSSVSFADSGPDLPNNLQCLDQQHQSMNYNNTQVMAWRSSTDNHFLNRGFIKGTIATVYPTQTNRAGMTHSHVAVDIDGIAGGDIELIFNDEFGPLPRLTSGMTVIACGDYITANAQSTLPSPMGAIIHWLHYNPGDRDGGKHSNGFVILDGKVYGFTTPAGNHPYNSNGL